MIRINIELVALNARYGHTNLAVRLLRECCNNLPVNISVQEFTVNTDTDYVLRSIYESKPDIIGLSCYIWNIEKLISIARTLRKLIPDIFILSGGPEVSYEYEEFLKKGVFDAIAIGESEEVFKKLVLHLLEMEKADCLNRMNIIQELNKIPGIAYGESSIINRSFPDMHISTSIGYTQTELEALHDRINYYEASRGCPYNCAYCLSGESVAVRFRSIEQVFNDLRIFLGSKVRLVKFVDRTFNCNSSISRRIWEYLINNDNKVTCFHFEIAADLLEYKDFELLKNARPGYFQFEAGIQTSNLRVLELVNRKCDTSKLAFNISELNRFSNINIHLDLIAGLPGDDMASFVRSIEFAYSLHPNQLQLGFLKLIKGSLLRREAPKLGLSYRDIAPYEVLSTPNMSYDDLSLLKLISEAIDMYHNSGMFKHSLRYFTHNGAWEFFFDLSLILKSSGLGCRAFGKPELFRILAEYCSGDKFALNLLKFDMLLNENNGNDPEWFPDIMDDTERQRAKEYFKKKKESLQNPVFSNAPKSTRSSRIYKFSFDIPGFISGGYKEIREFTVYVLFEYSYGRNSKPTGYSYVNIYV